MKRSALVRKSPMKPGKPMSRGSSVLKSSKPMARAAKPMAAVGKRAKRTGQGKVPPTAAERAWMDKIAAAGCIVCWLHHQVRTPGAVHHIIVGGRRLGHLSTICLCDPGHHQNSPAREKISRHPNKARFETAYGTELELLEASRALLGWDEDSPSSVSVAP